VCSSDLDNKTRLRQDFGGQGREVRELKTLGKKAAALLASSVLLTSIFTQAAYATDVVIAGNGSRSDNSVSVNTSSSNTLEQSNYANIDNVVRVSQNTGGNVASDNTGGNVTIRTGDADSRVSIFNEANKNVAEVSSCGGCVGGGTDVRIIGNGSKSDNNVDVSSSSNNRLEQTNRADFDNRVYVDQNTGRNYANDNTGRIHYVNYHPQDNYHPQVNYHPQMNYQSYMNYPQKYDQKYDQKNDQKYDQKKYDYKMDYNPYMSYHPSSCDYCMRVGNLSYGGNGSVRIDTGSADSDVGIRNIANLNIAH